MHVRRIVTDGTGRQVVQFNALRQHQRPALMLANGVVYVGWASHGDNGPYHGWMVGFDKNTLAVTGVLNTTPNGGLGGIWMAGGALSYDGAYFYAIARDPIATGQAHRLLNEAPYYWGHPAYGWLAWLAPR